MGTPDFAVESLRRLVEGGYNVVGVVTSVDKPAGRGLKVQQSAVKQYALEAGLPVLQPEKLKDPAFLEQFAALDADLGIVIAFRMLPEAVWAQPRLGTFNLHASLLPQYRGAAPINRAIMNGETVTGVTTFLLNSGMDVGAIIGRREVAIAGDDTAGTLHDKLMYEGADLVLETVDRLAAGTARPVVQPAGDEGLKPAPKIFKDDCRIDWSADARTVYNFVRGLSPYPAAWTLLRREGAEDVPVKIYGAAVSADRPDRTGSIASDGRTYISVSCGDGALRVGELQLAGKKRMTVEEFLRGFKAVADSFFE
jgi:methionyl-tRNA formyltransferase